MFSFKTSPYEAAAQHKKNYHKFTYPASLCVRNGFWASLVKKHRYTGHQFLWYLVVFLKLCIPQDFAPLLWCVEVPIGQHGKQMLDTWRPLPTTPPVGIKEVNLLSAINVSQCFSYHSVNEASSLQTKRCLFGYVAASELVPGWGSQAVYVWCNGMNLETIWWVEHHWSCRVVSQWPALKVPLNQHQLECFGGQTWGERVWMKGCHEWWMFVFFVAGIRPLT